MLLSEDRLEMAHRTSPSQVEGDQDQEFRTELSAVIDVEEATREVVYAPSSTQRKAALTSLKSCVPPFQAITVITVIQLISGGMATAHWV